jgi:uncharacterized protein (TIGR02266 family)
MEPNLLVKLGNRPGGGFAMSESDKKERRTHFRGKARPGRRVELEFCAADGPRGGPMTSAFTRNIGVGGAFIVTDRPAPVGARLTISLQVPTATVPIAVTAEVRWIGGDGDESGMGVKFSNLDVDQLLQLSEYFASLTGTEAAL